METTKNKALKTAKEELRNLLGVKKLSNLIIKNSSTQCDCGETYAIEVTGISKDKCESVIIGICKLCGNN